jgi:hypothetical protein
VQFFAPPAFWNRPWEAPPRKDLVGDYIEYERQQDSDDSSAPASLALRADGSMTVAGLPAAYG